MIKRWTHSENVTILNVKISYYRTFEYTRQNWMKVDNFTIITENFNIPTQ